MAKITATGVGIHTHVFSIVDTFGSGMLPVQVAIPSGSTATYRVLGRVNPEAPWVVIRDSISTGLLEAISYVPFVAIEVTAMTGAGPVVGWVGNP